MKISILDNLPTLDDAFEFGSLYIAFDALIDNKIPQYSIGIGLALLSHYSVSIINKGRSIYQEYRESKRELSSICFAVRKKSEQQHLKFT